MDEMDANVVDDNDTSYGKSNKGFEVMMRYYRHEAMMKFALCYVMLPYLSAVCL